MKTNQPSTIGSKYPWKRYWLPFGATSLTDLKGFPTLQSNTIDRTMIGQTLGDLADIPCLILLGEPGIGKSTEINNLASTDDNVLVSKYKLNRRSSEAALLSSIENQEEFSKWLNNGGKLYLYLDGLDEAILNIKTVHYSIVDWLNTNKRKFGLWESNVQNDRTFFLRITCRSAVWSSETTKDLEEIFGKENVKIHELAPLTQKSVRIAAKFENLDDEDFIEAILRADCVNFASEPITLKFLIESYKSKSLSKDETDKVKLYHAGCLRLCEEVNSGYLPSATLTASERLRIASRLAIYLILTNKTAVWKSSCESKATANDLTVDDVAGEDFVFDGARGTLSLHAINEVINTGLFSLLDENRLIFKHRTFAEFLAAWHLHSVAVPLNVLQQFLTSSHERYKAVPQIQEMISWLATMNTAVFNLFKSHEPFLLLRSSKSFSLQQKMDLVNSLLQLSSRFEILDNYESRKFYPRLRHNKLANQLKQIILNRSKNVVTRRIAIDIAGACREKSLVNALFEVLKAKDEQPYLRKEAIVAIGDMNERNVLVKLTDYALLDQPDDTDDELKGSALNALYPSVLSTKQVLGALTRIKRENLYASYKGFLDRLGYIIPEDDIEIAIEVLVSDGKFFVDYGRNEFEALIQKVVERAWARSMFLSSINLFAQLIYRMRVEHIGFSVPDDLEKRKQIIPELLRLIQDPSDVFHILGSDGNGSLLIKEDDWPWLMDLFKSGDETSRLKLGRILWTLVNFNHSQHTVEFLELIFKYDSLKNSFKYLLGPIEIDSEEARDIKRVYERRSKSQRSLVAESDKPILSFSAIEKCKTLLSEFSESNLNPWWQIIFYMRIDEKKGVFSSSHDFEFDVTKLPLWSALQDHHEHLVNVAKKYIEKWKPKTDWVLTEKLNRPELAGYKALLLIYKSAPEFVMNLSKEFWREWHAIVIYSTFNSINELPDDRKLMLRLCFNASRANSDIYRSLSRYLKYRLENNKELYDLYKLKDVADEVLARTLLKLLVDKSCNKTNQEHILDFLFERKLTAARKVSLSLFKQLISNAIKPSRMSLAMIASSRLLLNPEKSSWEDFWRLLTKSKVAGSLFIQAAPRLGFGAAQQVMLLTAKQKAEILVWLYKHFSFQDDSDDDAAFGISENDNIRQYRSEILRSIVNEGSVDSVNALRKASSVLKGVADFNWWLVSAREIMRRNTWVPPTPSQLRISLHNLNKRFVRSDEELLAIVEESLNRLQTKLRGNNPIAFFLWDCTKKNPGKKGPQFVPKDENSLSDFVKMHLDYDLIDRNLIVNREIEIKRSTGLKDGAKTDIFIQALNSEDGKAAFSLVIETKGCWHQELDSAMETQLKNKYLSKHKSRVGIFLVGWYYGDHLKAPKKHGDKATFRRKLEQQAKDISEPGLSVVSFVIDCGL